MAPHNFFRERRVLAAVGGAFDEVAFGPFANGRFYHITRFAVEDETTAPTGDIRVYVAGHGYTHWLIEQNAPAAATLYWEDRPVFLAEGESLVARFTGATAADRLALYVEGWWSQPANQRDGGRRPVAVPEEEEVGV